MKTFVVAVIGASLASADEVIAAWDNPASGWDESAVTASVGAWSNPCAQSPLKGTPTCDTSKSFEERAHDLVYVQEAKLKDSLSAYQGLTGNTAKSVDELNIPAYQWWSEALHGVANSPGVNYNGPIKATTMFPQVITTAASFNAPLMNQIGTVISTEARAMWNNHQAGLTFWAPNINIFRDPRWGRGQETPGEDPFLNAVYATNFVKGMQEGDASGKYVKASSCCKHYADYSLENADGHSRHNFNAQVSAYDQNDTYLVAFKYCAVGGNASSVMCSYNAENGIPSCANKEILTTLLRDDWGFQGYITSDCGAVSDVQNNHHYTSNSSATVDAVFGAGMDINCGGFTQKYAAAAMQGSNSILAEVQAAMYRAALVQMRLGLFDDAASTPWSSLGAADVCTTASLDLALTASRQGIVLLRNKGRVLPLDNSTIKSMANIGPNADNTNVMKGNYNGIPPFLLSVQDGLEMYVSSVQYEQGVAMATSNTSGIAAAVSAAQSADVTVLVMGLDQSQESEGHDRTSLALPGVQTQCIEQVAAAAKGPVVLVILSGGSVDVSTVSEKVDAIVWAGYPGMYGGRAIADVLFGEFNPTGRLTQTFYYANYSAEIQMSNMDMRPNATTGSPGRGYRYYDGDVVFAFGDGGSYSKFDCGDVDVKNGALVTTVKNTGDVPGGAAVLVFYEPENAGKDGVEIQRLVGFGRVDKLTPEQEETLTMDIYPEFLNGPEYASGKGSYKASCPMALS